MKISFVSVSLLVATTALVVVGASACGGDDKEGGDATPGKTAAANTPAGTKPAAAFAHLRTALAPGGRFAFICWRALDQNPWMAECVRAAFTVLPRPEPQPPHAPGPYAFADDARLRDILGASGYREITIDPLDHPLDLGSLDDAVVQMTRMGLAASAFAAASPAEQQAVLQEIRATARVSAPATRPSWPPPVARCSRRCSPSIPAATGPASGTSSIT